MTPDLSDVLEEGYRQISSGEVDLEAFLAAHPAEAAELRPLLEAALAVRRALAVDPDRTFARRARVEFAARAQAGPPRPWWRAWSLALRPVAVAIAAVALSGTVTVGGVAASQRALPGEPLYPIKRAQETARLVAARDDLDRATLRAQLAERRLRELRQIDVQIASEHGAELAQEIADHMRAVALAVERDREEGRITPETRARMLHLKNQVRASAIQHPEVLQEIADRLPPPRRPFLARMLRAAREEYERTLEAVELGVDAPPEELRGPPGGPDHPRPLRQREGPRPRGLPVERPPAPAGVAP